MDLFERPSQSWASSSRCPMSGRGKTRNGAALPKGNSGVYGGTMDPQPGDEMQGGWPRATLKEMDQRFAEAMSRALGTGQSHESRAIGASLEPRRQHDG